MEQFKKLGITQEILHAIKEQGFTEPSTIQEKTIPLVIDGKDVMARSATGSGKTLGFGAGIMQHTEKNGGLQALILTPTRELAEQVSTALKTFSKHKKLKILAIYGGVSINPQIKHLPNADIVVGTPGRILDHMERKTIDLSHIKTLVLDEADRMLDMGFIDDIRKISSVCPKKRQTLLFSATIPPEIKKLSTQYMHNPVYVAAEVEVDPRKLKQIYYDIDDKLKFSLLVHLLKQEKSGLVMVFCNSRKTVDFVADNLKLNGVYAKAIHGGFTQDKRKKALDQFHEKKAQVLVCTDVAARGLDIKGVSHVYNFDSPSESSQYVHRIGRTARAGKDGIAINLIASRDHENFGRVLQDTGVEVDKVQTPYVERVRIKVPTKSARSSPRSGPRQSRGPSRGPRRHARPRRK